MVYAVRLCLARVLLLALAALQVAAAATGGDAPADAAVVRLGIKRVPHNAEVERLVAKYHSSGRRSVVAGIRADLTAAAASFKSMLAGVWSSRVAFSRPAAMSLNAQAPPTLEAVETQIRTGEGSHTITVLVGGQARELIIDTGSGKTAFLCEGCAACGSHHHHPPYHFTNHTEYVACDVNDPGDPEMGGCMECVDAKCKYGQKYVEGDNWEAFKVSDEMSFPARGSGADAASSLRAIVEFGCIYAQTGCFNAQSSDGIMGFSRHPDAIYEQFFRQRTIRSRLFAQCLADDGGALTIGGVDMHLNRGPVAYTPLRDTGYQYWTVVLESISVGDVQLAVDTHVYNDDRGCVLDSGTTFVYLPTKVKSAFVAAWRKARAGRDEHMPLSDTYHRVDDSAVQFLPSICFHFRNDAQICMKPDTYMYKLASNEYAGTIFFGDEARSTIIGASALMHHNIIYDVDNNRVGMAKADCDAPMAVSSSDLSAEKMIALELHPEGDTFPRDTWGNQYWAQLALGAVTVCAVTGLVVTVWEEVQRKRLHAQAETPASSGAVGGGVAESGQIHAHAPHHRESSLEEEGREFDFFLMQDDD